jgi:hypothetical protein
MLIASDPRRFAYKENKPFYLSGTTVCITATGRRITYQEKWRVKELKADDLTEGQQESSIRTKLKLQLRKQRN